MNATAMVLEAPRRLVRRELPLPEIGDDDALLRVEACGLCGTDHEQYTGRSGRVTVRPRPRVGRDHRAHRARRGGPMGRRGGRPRGGRGVPVVPGLRRVRGRRVPALRASRDRRHVRLHPADPCARALGWVRHPSVPGSGQHGAARARRARSRRRHALQPARRRHPLGRHRPGDQAGRRGRGARAGGARPERAGRREGRRRGLRDGHRFRTERRVAPSSWRPGSARTWSSTSPTRIRSPSCAEPVEAWPTSSST